ncbi:MAG: hypothetical protein WCW47_03535 [Candidatus Paceibacterota bacterium]|jgi:hypothetical protein
MVSPKTQKIFIIAIVLLLLVFFGYRAFTKEPEILVDESTVLSDTEIAGKDILILVEKLKAISIDQNLFSSPMFSNLRDFSQIIFPEAKGRTNPFATIGSDGSFSVTPTATTTGRR